MDKEPRPIADFVETTLNWQVMVILTAALWTDGFFMHSLDSGTLTISDDGTALGVNIGTRLLLAVCMIGIAFTATKVASGLALPTPWKWGAGAWVPCANPIVVVALSAMLLKAYQDHGLSLSLLFASRSRLERET